VHCKCRAPAQLKDEALIPFLDLPCAGGVCVKFNMVTGANLFPDIRISQSTTYAASIVTIGHRALVELDSGAIHAYGRRAHWCTT
jgi:hypothetical protein